MIVGTDDIVGPGNITEYPTDAGSVFKAAGEISMADNPFTKLVQWGDTQFSEGRIVPKKEAEEMVAEKRVKLDIPEEGMKSEALDILIERQYQRKRRQEVIDGAEGTLGNVSAFAGGLTASLMDPLNLAANFIPFVGQAKYALMLTKAAGPLSRTLIRGGVGAVEGFLGQAVLEPLNYVLGNELGDDYTAMNTFMNLTFGTVMGGGLHMGMGAISDALSKGKTMDMSGPKGDFPTQLDSMTPEQRLDLGKTALAQMIDDRPVNIDPILMEIEGRVPAVEDFKAEIEKANTPANASFWNPEIVERHNQQIKEIPLTMEVQDAQKIATFEMQELTNMAELEGVDITPFKEMVDKMKIENDDFISILKNMANCVGRGR
jgi:hypothetical protein